MSTWVDGRVALPLDGASGPRGGSCSRAMLLSCGEQSSDMLVCRRFPLCCLRVFGVSFSLDAGVGEDRGLWLFSEYLGEGESDDECCLVTKGDLFLTTCRGCSFEVDALRNSSRLKPRRLSRSLCSISSAYSLTRRWDGHLHLYLPSISMTRLKNRDLQYYRWRWKSREWFVDIIGRTSSQATGTHFMHIIALLVLQGIDSMLRSIRYTRQKTR